MRIALVVLLSLLYACEECPTYEACQGTDRDAALSAAPAAAGDTTGDTDTDTDEVEDTGFLPEIDGEAVFVDTCSECHGEDGRKGGGCAILPSVVPGKTAWDLEQILTHGYGEMPAQSLDAEAQEAVIAYVLERWGD